MKEFAIRVGRDEHGNIISLQLADLKLELLDILNETDLNKKYRSCVASIPTNHKTISNMLRQITPKTIKELKAIYANDRAEDDYLYHWETFELEFNRKYQIFSKLLPIAGLIATTVEVTMDGGITYMALRVSSSSNDSSSDSSTSFSLFGAVLDSLMLIIMYVGSDATGLLTRLGENIDQSLEQYFCNSPDEIAIISREKDGQLNFSRNTATLFVHLCIVSSIIISVISSYQEVSLLIDKYLSLSPEHSKDQTEHEEYLLKMGLKLLVFASSYTSLAFQSSLALNLLQKFFNKVELRKTREIQDGLHFQYRPISGNGSTYTPNSLSQQDLPSEDVFPVNPTRQAPLRLGNNLS